MDRQNIDKIAQTPEDRLLLAKLWDKLNAGLRKNIPASTCFLSLREQELARYLLGNLEGLTYFGGFEDAQRKILMYLPDYLTADSIGEDCPIVCLRARFYEADSPSHRDFLGALMGIGIARESLGDILVGKGCCDFFVLKEIAPYVMQNFESAGRTKLRLEEIPLAEVSTPQPEIREVSETLASLRLDSIIAAGFRISRAAAAGHITGGKVSIDGLPTEKPDKTVDAGKHIAVRGLGKIKLHSVKGQTKKGRISVIIHRYI